MKRAVISVSNDLFSDQRVDKVCNSLTDMGFEVLLVGRCYKDSPQLATRKYRTKRLHLLFRKGAKFYAEFNIRLFVFLLFQKCDVLVSNDLDTLLPYYLVSRIRRKKLIYDSHEYFCGVPELMNRPRIQKIWRRIERFCFPHLETVITVNQSIADIYDKEYPRKNKVNVVRNVPTKQKPEVTETRKSLGLPTDKRLIVMQGAINQDRGAEELIAAMRYIENALLLIIGNGDKIPTLKEQVRKGNLTDKVRFIGRIEPDKLFNYTSLCDIGCSLEKDTNINYRYCLPNKVFDYIKAGIPCIVSKLPEMTKLVAAEKVGIVIENHHPETIADAINRLLDDTNLYNRLKNNTIAASEKFCWENEEVVLRKIYLNGQ